MAYISTQANASGTQFIPDRTMKKNVSNLLLFILQNVKEKNKNLTLLKNKKK